MTHSTLYLLAGIMACFASQLYGEAVPDSLRYQLDSTKPESRVEIWERWFRAINKDNFKSKITALDEACDDVHQILSREDAAQWCLEMRLKTSNRVNAVGGKTEGMVILQELKPYVDSIARVHHGQHSALASWHLYFGVYNYGNRDYDVAWEYFDKAETMAEVVKDSMTLLGVYRGKSNILYTRNQMLEALEYYDRTDKISAQMGQNGFSARPYYKGIILTELRRYDEAGTEFAKLIDSLHLFHGPMLGRIKIGYAHNLFMLGQQSEALAYFEQMHPEMSSHDLITQTAFFRYYARCLGLYGDYERMDMAIDSFQGYLLRDAQMRRNNEIISWQTKFRTAEKEAKIKALEKDQVIAQAQFKTQIISIAAISLALLALLAFLLLKARDKRRQLTLVMERDRDIAETRKRLFYSISHDIRTPLALLLAPLERAMQNSEKTQTKADINLAQRHARRLLELFNQIMDWNKAEAKALTFNPQTGDLRRVAENLSLRFEQMALENGIQLEKRFDLPNGVLFFMDFDKLDRILTNLVNNAIKYCEPGQQVSLSMQLIKEGHSQFLKAIVKDNGPGIPIAEQSSIFHHFVQGELGRHKGGSGIGLALVKELIHLVKGQIELESTPGLGTSFTLKIPTSKIQAANIIENNDRHTQSSTKPLILLIEDEPELLDFLASALEPDYQVQIAQTASIGLSIAHSRIPDLIITDWMLPDQSGHWVCQNIREDELTSHIPILVLTALNDPKIRQIALHSGAMALIKKPFRTHELREQIHAILEQQFRARQKWSNARQAAFESPVKKNIAARTDPFMMQFFAILQRHLDDESLTVELIAQQLHISRVQLFRKIKSLTGKSPSQHLRQMRLEKARELLQQSKLSISEIAYQVGFSDANYFSTAYKKYFQVSPTEDKRSIMEKRN